VIFLERLNILAIFHFPNPTDYSLTHGTTRHPLSCNLILSAWQEPRRTRRVPRCRRLLWFVLQPASPSAITTCKLYEQTAEPASVFLRVSSSPFVSTTLPVLLHGGHLTDEEEPSNSDVERSIQWGNFQFDCF
jgi:hypothetical protein